jgi:hypothetical protein
MSPRGRRLLIFVLLSIGCAKSSKEAEAPAEPGVDADYAEQAPGAPRPAAVAAPAPAEEAPSSTKDEGALSLDQAVADFDRARLELSHLLGRDIGPVAESSTRSGAGAAQAEPAPRAPATEKSRAESEAPKAKPLKKGDDGCANVCRAFESLSRSAAAVCRLDDGERCRKANAVVSVAQDDAGVRACACKK